MNRVAIDARAIATAQIPQRFAAAILIIGRTTMVRVIQVWFIQALPLPCSIRGDPFGEPTFNPTGTDIGILGTSFLACLRFPLELRVLKSTSTAFWWRFVLPVPSLASRGRTRAISLLFGSVSEK